MLLLKSKESHCDLRRKSLALTVPSISQYIAQIRAKAIRSPQIEYLCADMWKLLVDALEIYVLAKHGSLSNHKGKSRLDYYKSNINAHVKYFTLDKDQFPLLQGKSARQKNL